MEEIACAADARDLSEIRCTESFRGRVKRKSEVHLLGKKGYLMALTTPQQMVQSDVKFPRKY